MAALAANASFFLRAFFHVEGQFYRFSESGSAFLPPSSKISGFFASSKLTIEKTGRPLRSSGKRFKGWGSASHTPVLPKWRQRGER
jgi:hypothetical protein